MKRFCAGMVLCCLALVPSLLCAGSAQSATDEKEVVVLGIGNTESEAKKQAYRSAIQSVIGSMVLSETIVENESLVQDKILSHSDGYVVKSAQIGPTRTISGNLLEVTMRVTVKSEQLKAKLKAENITMAVIDGQSLFAQNTTQEAQNKDAASIIKEKIKGVPASVLTAEANVQASTQKNLEGGLVALTVPVKLSVDRVAYRKFIGELKKTLQKLGYQGKAMQLPLAMSDTFKTHDSHVALSAFNKAYNKKLADDDYPNKGVILVGEGYQSTNNLLSATGYVVPKDAAIAFHNEASFTLTVELLDANGNVILEQAWTNGEEMRKDWLKFNKISKFSLSYDADGSIIRTTNPAAKVSSGNYGAMAYVLPSPFICKLSSYTDFYAGNPTLPITFELSLEELQNVTSLRCTVSNL